MMPLPRLRGAWLAPTLLLTLALPVSAQQQELDAAITRETFLTPPQEIADAILAPRHLNVTLGNPSPDRTHFLRQQSEGLPSMASFAKPFYRLGGMQIDWRANRSRQFTVRGGEGFDLIDWKTGAVTSIQVPQGTSVSSARWSPDGSRVAFFGHSETATHIFVADKANGRSRQVTRTPVLATAWTSFEWTPDSRSVVTVLLPPNRANPPAKPEVPPGPQVRVTTSDENSLRTYPDLLEDPWEQELLQYYTTGQLAIVDVQSRATRNLGAPAMIQSAEVSPDGSTLRVTTMRKPFSYIVPVSQFGNAQELWSVENGSILAQIAEQRLRDGAPVDSSARNGDPEKRNIAWRPDGQGLSFLQQEPRQPGDSARADDTTSTEGNANRSRRKDRVMQWLPPYDDNSVRVVYESDNRLSNVRYSADAQILFLTEQQGQNRHEYAVFVSDPSTRHTISRGRVIGGGFGGGRSPDGNLVTRTLDNGTTVVQLSSDGGHVFLSGTKYHEDPIEQGPQSFIDRVQIRGGAKTRVYESENQNVFERVLEIMNDDATQLIVSREGRADVPDSFFRDVASGELRQLTENEDYTPDLTRAQRRRYEVPRADGLKFAVDVTLPPTTARHAAARHVLVLSARVHGQDTYDRTLRTYNKNRFPNAARAPWSA
jgi:hypothetical protein